jgi:adenine-specific DNA-methyltransferase
MQKVSVSYLEAQLYNYLLNFFELYYQNGDFGYNNCASQAFKLP